MEALILAGGTGTRPRPVARLVPEKHAPLSGKPAEWAHALITRDFIDTAHVGMNPATALSGAPSSAAKDSPSGDPPPVVATWAAAPHGGGIIIVTA